MVAEKIFEKKFSKDLAEIKSCVPLQPQKRESEKRRFGGKKFLPDGGAGSKELVGVRGPEEIRKKESFGGLSTLGLVSQKVH